MRPLRLHAYSRFRRCAPGYVGYEEIHFQDLQEKHWWGWKVIGREEVPNYAFYSNAFLGDSSGWRSRFSYLGDFPRRKSPVPFRPYPNMLHHFPIPFYGQDNY
jgi:hypothetical protein